MEKQIQIQGTKITIKFRTYSNPSKPDIKAYCSVILNDLFVMHGFTIRTSKHFPNSSDMLPERYWVAKPMSGKGFRYFEISNDGLWKELERKIIDLFLYEQIPVIDEVEELP